jgi:outer membrane immunogenic protein
MKRVSLLLITVLSLVLFSQEASAQDNTKNRVGFFLAAASGDIDEVGIGGIAEFKLAPKWSLSPQLIFYFPENRGGADVSFFELNVNANYYFYNHDVFEFYGLAGLNYLRWKVDYGTVENSDGEIGLNLGGGINFEVGKSFVPFSEVRLTIGEFDQFVISAGLKFNLGN